MTTSRSNYSGLMVGSIIKSLALGLICISFFAAQDNLEALVKVASGPLYGNNWSEESINSELSSAQTLSEIVGGLVRPEIGTTLVLTLLACISFGVWEGKRLVKTRRLEESLRNKSQRVLAANKRLQEMTVTDPLTGLANRRLFFQRLEEEQVRAERYGTSLSCMMIDIDFFKNINDTYGHQFGDYVLEEIARILTAQCRKVDTIARYGGEEFAIVLPNTSTHDAVSLSERIRNTISDFYFDHAGLTARITATLGVAGWRAEDGTETARFLARADSALYDGKKNGRNATVLWSEDVLEIDQQTEVIRSYMDDGRVSDLRERLLEMAKDFQHTCNAAVQSLLSAIKIRDGYTLRHSYDVSYYAGAIAQHLEMSDAAVETIINAGALHDIGKLAIDERILTKPGKLNDNEYAAMKVHPTIAAQILGPMKFLSKEIPMIVHHHERYDGKGYPHGIAGEDIPFGARIIAVADAFSAMTTDRPYQKAIPVKKALQRLVDEAGAQFDLTVVQAFLESIQEGKVNMPAPGDQRFPMLNTTPN